MTRPVLASAVALLLPAAASAFWPYPCYPYPPVYPVPVYVYPPVYAVPVCVCPPAATAAPAPAKPAASQGPPRVYSEPAEVRPAKFAEPVPAPADPTPVMTPKADAIPKTDLPAAPKAEPQLPKLPEPPVNPPKPPADAPADGGLKLPELPPLPSVSKYRPDPAADAVSVTVVPATGGTGRVRTADFYNYTGRALALTVDGRSYRLPARHAVAVAVGTAFTWSLGDGPARTDRLAADASGAEVMLK